MNPIIEIQGLTRGFKRKIALDSVSLRHEKGTVLGLVGENGAGKTTLIKCILGLLKPDSGTVKVFGLDPVAEPVSVLGRIGYLSEEDMLPGWMRVHDLQRYMRGFYPGWDSEYAQELCAKFQLDQDAKLRSLSKGQRARAGLMATLAYRPDLLLLDEPSSGLDPVVRRDILSAIVRAIVEEGRTVLLSSHMLGEVDRVADRVVMLKEGQVVLSEDIDELKISHVSLTFISAEPRANPPSFQGVLSAEGSGREWSVIYRGTESSLFTLASGLGAAIDDCRRGRCHPDAKLGVIPKRSEGSPPADEVGVIPT